MKTVQTVLCTDAPGARIHLNAPLRKQAGSEPCSFLGTGVPAQWCLCGGPCWHTPVLSPRQRLLQASGIIAAFGMNMVCNPALREQKPLLLSGRLGKALFTGKVLCWLREIKVDNNCVIGGSWSCRASKPLSSETFMSDSRKGTGV